MKKPGLTAAEHGELAATLSVLSRLALARHNQIARAYTIDSRQRKAAAALVRAISRLRDALDEAAGEGSSYYSNDTQAFTERFIRTGAWLRAVSDGEDRE